MYRRGRLLSEFFLTEGIRTHPAYLAITDAQVAAARAFLVDRINALAAMAAPSEAQTEADLIQPIISKIGDNPGQLPPTGGHGARSSSTFRAKPDIVCER